MAYKNKVFIACSLDGFIADKDGKVDWLHSLPVPENEDMGYKKFMSEIDALVMGRVTFETVCSFDVPWPYEKPVFVLSNSLTKVSDEHKGKVQLLKGSCSEILHSLHAKGHQRLYIDGGKTIQRFLKEDLIDEMILTTIPIVLGDGFPLFSPMNQKLEFACTKSRIYAEAIVQNHFIRKR